MNSHDGVTESLSGQPANVEVYAGSDEGLPAGDTRQVQRRGSGARIDNHEDLATPVYERIFRVKDFRFVLGRGRRLTGTEGDERTDEVEQ